MTMDRRTLVKTVAGASVAVPFAGCISTEEPEDSNGDDTDDDTGGTDSEYEGDAEALEPEDGLSGEADIWHSLSDGELASFEGHIDEFNGLTDAEIAESEIADLDDRTISAIPAGEGPESFMWAHDWVGNYHENGFLSDQSDALRVDLDTYSGAAREAIEYEGEIVALPYAAETVALLYNKDLVDEPPETFDEMREIMAEHHAPDDASWGLAHSLDPYFYSAWVHAFGGYYYRETGDLGLTNDETIEGFEFVLDEIWPYIADDWDHEAQESIFREGNAPLAINGPWFIGDLDFEVGVAPFPELDGGEPSPYTGVQLFYFTSEMDEDEERADVARSFAEWYTTNPDIISEMANEHGFIPVHEDFVDDEQADELAESVQGFAEAVDQGVPMPAHPEMDAVWGPVEEEFEEALQENKSIEAAMEDAESRIRDNWD